MPRVTYAQPGDMMLGSVPLPTNGDAVKYLEAAADEIDASIGMRYSTPVVVDNSPITRPVGLLLKKINAWLGSGRLLMAADSAGSDDQVQQYGLYLVTEATAALKQISDGTIVLPGIDLVDPDAKKNTGPAIAVADEYSLVEQFGATFGNPAVNVLETTRPRLPYSNYPYSPYTY